MSETRETFLQQWGIIIFAVIVLLAVAVVGLYFGVFHSQQQTSWKQPSLDKAMRTIEWCFGEESDVAQSYARLTMDRAFRFSEDSTYREDGTSTCGTTIVLFPVLKRLFAEAVERARYYHPQYTRNEIKDYLRRNGNTLVVSIEMFSSFSYSLEDYAVLIIQDSTVIRPVPEPLPPVVHTDITDALKYMHSCTIPTYIVRGDIAFDVKPLDPYKPFQIKVIRESREMTFDVDFNVLGFALLLTGSEEVTPQGSSNP